MLKTYAARIHNGLIEPRDPTPLVEGQRVLVTVLEEPVTPRVASNYAGAFSRGHKDTGERADEILNDLGFAE